MKYNWLKLLVLGECGYFKVYFRKIQFQNFSFLFEWIFQGVKNVENCILTLIFPFWSKLWSLITPRHAVRSLWNYQKSIPARYTSDLRTFQGVVIFIRGSEGLEKFGKKSSQNCFLNFNVKYFLHKRTLRWTCIKPRKYFRLKCTWEKNNF